MKDIIETERLILREIEFTDENDMFELESDPEVHLYIENNPVKSIEKIREIIGMLRNQYKKNGVGRWALINKQTNEFLGCCGLKYFEEPLNNYQNFYELGYRFKKKHWGQGFATEATLASIEYGFNNLNIDAIYAITDPKNTNSISVLKKIGFNFIETFNYEGDLTDWFELEKSK
jgi:[ribosomal protein S5]-alanine N-acetyltransferase